MHDLKGKVALVTGNSRGIGPYISRALAQEGAIIVGVARSAEGLQKTEEEIRSAGGSCFSIPFDLKELDNLPGLVLKATTLAGKIDILVNNAGMEVYRHYVKNSREDLTSMLTLNLQVPMELTRIVLPAMLDRGGHVVNIASLAGKKGVIFNSIYSATKAGMINWTDGMAQELRGTGVGMSVICPGYVRDIGMFASADLKPPFLLGMTSPQAVADAVVKAIRENRPEIIVNPGPIKPLLAIAALAPSFSSHLLRWMGIGELNRKRVDRQQELDKKSPEGRHL